jgi:hypothetical protein
MPGKKKELWIVTVSDERPIKKVAADLKAAGFDVDQVLEEVGTVTGSAASDKVEQLRKIQGVKDVSPDHPVTMS